MTIGIWDDNVGIQLFLRHPTAAHVIHGTDLASRLQVPKQKVSTQTISTETPRALLIDNKDYNLGA